MLIKTVKPTPQWVVLYDFNVVCSASAFAYVCITAVIEIRKQICAESQTLVSGKQNLLDEHICYTVPGKTPGSIVARKKTPCKSRVFRETVRALVCGFQVATQCVFCRSIQSKSENKN